MKGIVSKTNDEYNITWPDISAMKDKQCFQQGRQNRDGIPKQPQLLLKNEERHELICSSNQHVNTKPMVSNIGLTNNGIERSKLDSANSTTYQCTPISPQKTIVDNTAAENCVVSGFCDYWKKIEDFQYLYQSDNRQIVPQTNDSSIFKSYLVSNSSVPLHQNSDPNNGKPGIFLTREEIVARRKIKVAERREIKKLEKKQLKEIVSGVQAAKPDFSLEQAKEDFPELNEAKKFKKTNKFHRSSVKREINCAREDDISVPNSSVEKSWKPKVKDPISFNLNEALQAPPERFRPAVKMINTQAQRNVLIGNLLDSDHPQQKKGKVRPDKLRKPSRLKGIILKERSERHEKLNSDGNSKPYDEESIHPFYSEYGNDDIIILLEKCAFVESIEEQSNEECMNPKDQPNVEVVEYAKRIHSKKFREYCTNCITTNLITSVCKLLDRIAQFQDRTFVQNPIKASAKRRYVAGIHQTNKYLQVKKVKMLIIAPDLEENSGEGGLDEIILQFKKETEIQGVPCVFGPNRKRLGRSVFKKALVSCVAVLSYDGAEEQFAKVLQDLQEAQSKYHALIHVQDPETNAETDDVQLTKNEHSVTGEDVTLSLLRTLTEVSPADRLLSALQRTAV